MTVNEKIETNADLVKWCVHIIGPDDLMAAPCHDAAVTYAHQLNRVLYSRSTIAADEVLCFAYAAPWPHDEKSYAEDLAKWSERVSN